jgi:hypothetical protein
VINRYRLALAQKTVLFTPWLQGMGCGKLFFSVSFPAPSQAEAEALTEISYSGVIPHFLYNGLYNIGFTILKKTYRYFLLGSFQRMTGNDSQPCFIRLTIT